MSTKERIWRRVFLGAVAGILVLTTGAARADVVADQSAAILVFPKISVDKTGVTGSRVDTMFQVSNTSRFLVRAHCFYVNANSNCSNAGAPVPGGGTVPLVCKTNLDCNPGGLIGGVCQPRWNERDFQLTLTKRQPISWRASEGLTSPCPPGFTHEQCSAGGYVPLSGGRRQCFGAVCQDNEDTAIPPVEQDPFTGELKCIEVSDDAAEKPIDRNDLKGEATIVRTRPTGGVDVSKYNAIGIQSISGAQDADAGTLLIGGPNPEYNACPSVVVLDHFFDTLDIAGNVGVATHRKADGNADVTGRVATHIVVVPCSQDFAGQNAKYGAATLQFLIYNEFEQRFSTSTRVDCYKDVQLSDIDTRPITGDNITSIFSAVVQGTLTGQTRIRPVIGQDRPRKVLVVAEEVWENGNLGQSTTARNIHSVQGDPATAVPDVITLP